MGRRSYSSSAASKGGKKKNDSSATASAGSSSVVGKLQMLREFCPSFSESDLSTCLSQAGYNVELAAERLMTGQFQPSKVAATTSITSTTTTVKQAPSASASPTESYQQKTPATNKKRPSPTTTSRPEKKRSPHVIPPTPHYRSTPSPRNSTPQQQSLLATNSLLLCERWLVGTCMTRKGRVQHQEVLQLTHAQNGKQFAVRFRGNNVEGTLCKSLSLMLSPLLRYQVEAEEGDNNQSQSNSNHQNKLIDLRAEALMDDHNIILGGEVPLKLTVYIRHPEAFFALFDADKAQANSKSSSSMFFSNQKGKQKSTTKGKMTVTEAAFAFLQWAQYGNLPEIPDFSAAAAKNSNATKDGDDDNDMEDDHDESEDDEMVLKEEDFVAECNSQGGEQISEQPDWAKSMNDDAGSDKATSSLPEMEDPNGFDSVVLRPYQRQALYWMMKREQEGDSREELEKELALLSELSGQNSNDNDGSNSGPALLGMGQAQQDISCDCGPVLVSESARKTAKTLSGEANPVNHPLWKPRYLTNPGKKSAYLFYVNELLGVATCHPPAPPKQCSGGILADDMGLGKTVMLLALIMKCKEKTQMDAKNAKGAAKHGPTLIIAPLSLLAQWEEEIETKTSLSYRICYGDQAKDRASDSAKVDVVLTTYGTIQAELQKQLKQSRSSQSFGLLETEWLRIILDEAHSIKNANTLVSKACCAVTANYRWVVTGTVIHNSLDDVFALIKFLQHQPWCEPAFWKAAVSSEMHRVDQGEADNMDGTEDPTGLMVALGRVRRLLSPLMLRRTKDSRSADGQPILTLPPIESKVVTVHLTSAEREFYNGLLERSMDIFNGFIKAALTVKSHINEEDWNVAVAGSNEEAAAVPVAESVSSPRKAAAAKATVDDAFLNGLLQQFRQAHHGDNSYPEKVAHALHSTIKDNNATHLSEECPICLDTPLIENACVTNPCAHLFCSACLIGVLKDNAPSGRKSLPCPDGICPVCQSDVEASKIILLSKKKEGGYTTGFLLKAENEKKALSPARPSKKVEGARLILENAVNGAQSSKLAAVVRELHRVWEVDPGSKILVFSQFLGFLDLMETALSQSGIPYGRLDGKMTLKQRIAALDLFKTDTNGKEDDESDGTKESRTGSVMLASMRAGGIGLNMVAASSVFIVDPWWNDALEVQCINRIHRIGQKAQTVRVRKFVCENTVEEKIVALQKKKKGMANEVYSDLKADGTMESGRPTIDDFKLIFGNL